MILSDYEHELLTGWEEVFKKGQLTLWILLALKDGPKHMADIKSFITTMTHESLIADDKSMYRALRRYRDAEMIDYDEVKGNGGPDRKRYALTAVGQHVLASFVQRNISDIYFKSAVKELLQ